MYREYPEREELYILHRYSVGTSQGDESFLEEIIATGDDREQLEAIGRSRFPASDRGSWRYDDYMIVVNISTEAGRVLYEAQKTIWKEQWKQIDEHPENYVGAQILGNRDGGPIALWMQHNPELDTPSTLPFTDSYQYLIFDVSDGTTPNTTTYTILERQQVPDK